MHLLRSLVLLHLPSLLWANLLLPQGETVEEHPVSVRHEDGIPTKEISHSTFQFPSDIVQRQYFPRSTTILVRLRDNTIWQSSNEGHSWRQLFPGTECLDFYIHRYNHYRAYIITNTNRIYSTTDAGRTWNHYSTPTPANTFGAQVLSFHPDSDNLLWIGDRDCPGPNCHAEAQYTRDNGRRWSFVENYVRNCAWGSEFKLNADSTEIVCQSYREKTGAQRFFGEDNPLRLVEGTGYFAHRKEMFEWADEFAKLAEFSLVVQRETDGHSLRLHVSLDGEQFSEAVFPRPLIPDVLGLTFLWPYTGSLFIHSATSQSPNWGSLLKSNYNGTKFSVSAQFVNAEDRSAVDFQKSISRGLEGIAIINIVSNPNEAVISGQKALQTRITFNDGASWRPLFPPPVDSNNDRYACNTVGCTLHLHCRPHSITTYAPLLRSTHPDVTGVLVGIGSVGLTLAPYNSDESATFLSRDAGWTWEEVRKGTHLWAFSDAGAVLVMASDEAPTDRLLFSTDQGLSWKEYQFTKDEDMKLHVKEIVTPTGSISKKWSFLLVGKVPRTSGDTVVEIDLTALASGQCNLDTEDTAKSDFELWNPTDKGHEACMFGRQTLYYRPKRNATCTDGARFAPHIVRNCTCTRASDFECDLGYMKNDTDECDHIPGVPQSFYDGSDVCRTQSGGVWSEPPAYRKMSFSTCEDGYRPALPARHACPIPTPEPDQPKPEPRIGNTIWLVVFALLILFMVGIAAALCRRCARKKSEGELGSIRLFEDGPAFAGGGSLSSDAPLDVPTPPSAERPWFVIRGFKWVRSRLGLTRPEGITLEGDEDAQLLHLPAEPQN